MRGLSSDLATYARGLVGAPATTYGGPLTAGMGEGETNILNSINKLVMGSDGAFTPSASMWFGDERSNLIGDILSGKRLDPTSNPYLQSTMDAIRTAGNETLGQNLNMIDAAFGRANLGPSSSGRSREAIETGRRVTSDVNNQIGNILANNYQQGLQEQMTTLGSVLPGMDQYSSGLLFSALGANALPRQVQQNQITADYNEFLRRLSEPMQNAQLALSIMSGTPMMNFMQQQYRPSSAAQLLSALSQGGQAAAPFLV